MAYDQPVAHNTAALRELTQKLCDIENDVSADDLRLLAKALDEIRTNFLFSDEIHDGSFGSLSEQDYLLGLNAMETAQRFFDRAATFRAGELAGRF